MADVEKTPVGRGIGVHALAGEIVAAVASDEQNGGCDLSAGMFGPAMSALIRKIATEYLAPLQPPSQEPVGEPVGTVHSGKYASGMPWCEVEWHIPQPAGTKLYTAPPAQAVDLEQFRRVAKYAKYWADEKGNDEVGAAADRLLALIDAPKEARNG